MGQYNRDTPSKSPRKGYTEKPEDGDRRSPVHCKVRPSGISCRSRQTAFQNRLVAMINSVWVWRLTAESAQACQVTKKDLFT